jgi:hypothetical protein
MGIRGLFLDQTVFQQQRDATDGLKRGFILVLLVGLVLGVAAMIGQVGEFLVSHDIDVAMQVIYERLIVMPWYQNLSSSEPGFDAIFKQRYDQITGIIKLFEQVTIPGALLNLVIAPIRQVALWLIYGVVAHMVARIVGGRGSLAQTLGCTALASGVSLLGIIQVVPFAQVSGVFLLTMIANYLAIREAHELTPRQAFWATIFAPLLLLLLALGAVGVAFFMIINASG